ncbi:glycosyltransferase [Paracoccus sp. YIM 132242]|uniref:Glycosyltransferase n=1 Tax=Paracoccus lichenicola TaxID=2665644 RepID=A0A6L6HS44_9RHOB|nr:glycosyltransferase [Paracoccus lichenicola]MTE01142.1 glycosyltransferase [Paracoccus lichenicola]
MAGAPSILIIHDHFPGQFGALALHLAANGWDVTFATRTMPVINPGYRVVSFTPHRGPSSKTHPYAQPMDRAVLTGQAFARTGIALRNEGYRPHVIVCHSGWGAGLFAKDIFPEARLVSYAEWWYNSPGADIAFLAGSYPDVIDSGPDARMMERARNAHLALDLSSADACLCPTHFQAAQFPASIKRDLIVGHDGIDTSFFSPGPPEDPTLGGRVPDDARVVTFATRGMEPHRGFPEFMKAVPSIIAADRRIHVVIAGQNKVVYGPRSIRVRDWKAEALSTLNLDPARVVFTGALRVNEYRNLLRRSDAHVYLTVPFVLSWSMLEAMSAARRLVLSDTSPVREFAGTGQAILSAISPPSIADAVLEALDDVSDRSQRARDLIKDRIPLHDCLSFRQEVLSQFL